jgi:hypothetical protein
VKAVHFTEKLNNSSIETNGLQLLRKTVIGEKSNPSERNRGNPLQVHGKSERSKHFIREMYTINVARHLTREQSRFVSVGYNAS